MFKIIVVKNLAEKQRKKYLGHIAVAEKALRQRNRRIAYLSKKMYGLQEKVAELEYRLDNTRRLTTDAVDSDRVPIKKHSTNERSGRNGKV